MPAIAECDSVELYWRDVGDVPPLSHKQEKELFGRIHNGDEEALEELVRANLRFVVTIANFYKGTELSLLELISEGNLGLLEAMNRFDETRGFKFITYAVHWIKQAILKALAQNSKIARVPMSRVTDSQKIQNHAAILAQELDRFPDEYEVAQYIGISNERVYNAMEVGKRDISLDVPEYPDEDGARITSLPDSEQNIEQILEQVEMEQTVEECFGVLDEREQKILRLYFGFIEGEDPLTLEQIGGIIGVTRERVRQVRDQALGKLRARYGELLEDFR